MEGNWQGAKIFFYSGEKPLSNWNKNMRDSGNRQKQWLGEKKKNSI